MAVTILNLGVGPDSPDLASTSDEKEQLAFWTVLEAELLESRTLRHKWKMKPWRLFAALAKSLLSVRIRGGLFGAEELKQRAGLVGSMGICSVFKWKYAPEMQEFFNRRC